MTIASTDGGLRAFIVIWFGQLVSTLGMGLTGFAVGVWIFERTGSATQFALSNVFYLLPQIGLSPIAGALVDRWDRRLVMILAEMGQALATAVIALLLLSGHLEVWHIYLAVAASSSLAAFQRPAYAASVSLLVPKALLGRAAGAARVGDAISRLVSPVAAGFLLASIGLGGILLSDMVASLTSAAMLLAVRIPRPDRTTGTNGSSESLLQEIAFGWKFLIARPPLSGILLIVALLNFFANAALVLTTPMVLSFASTNLLGAILTTGGAGFVCGSVVMSVWGGTKRRINAFLAFILVQGIAIALIGLRPSVALISAGYFCFFFGFAIVGASALTIWQTKIPADVQGRVFSTSTTLAMSVEPLAHVTAGPLADRLFEPLMAVNGPLAGNLGRITGVGPGRGMGLLQVIMGICIVVVGIAAYVTPLIRRVEDEIPDAVPGRATTLEEDRSRNLHPRSRLGSMRVSRATAV